MQANAKEMKKNMGVASATSIVVGCVIGAGVFQIVSTVCKLIPLILITIAGFVIGGSRDPHALQAAAAGAQV